MFSQVTSQISRNRGVGVCGTDLQYFFWVIGGVSSALGTAHGVTALLPSSWEIQFSSDSRRNAIRFPSLQNGMG
jgi:hypothetical protein